jgi:hypothetical protein
MKFVYLYMFDTIEGGLESLVPVPRTEFEKSSKKTSLGSGEITSLPKKTRNNIKKNVFSRLLFNRERER